MRYNSIMAESTLDIQSLLPEDLMRSEDFRAQAIWGDFIYGLIGFRHPDKVIEISQHLVDLAGGINKELLAIVEKILARTITVTDEKLGRDALFDVFNDFDDWAGVPWRRDYANDEAYLSALTRWRTDINDAFVSKYQPDTHGEFEPRVTRSDLFAACGLIWGITENPRAFSPLRTLNASALRQESLAFLHLPPQ